MKWLKDNLLNNNSLGTFVTFMGVLYAVLTDIFGCDLDASNNVSCLATWIPAWMLPWLLIAFGGLAIFTKVMRIGGPLRGLFGKTAVIVPSSEAQPGVVTQKQVEADK